MSDIYDYITGGRKLYVTKYPEHVDIKVYRGDSWSYTLIGRNGDDSPFDWNVADEFSMQFRAGHPLDEDICAELSPANFVLGASQAAIDYDIAQGNPAGTTMDELHILNQDGSILKDVDLPRLFYDLQFTVGGDVFTPIKGKLLIETDVTRGEPSP